MCTCASVPSAAHSDVCMSALCIHDSPEGNAHFGSLCQVSFLLTESKHLWNLPAAFSSLKAKRHSSMKNHVCLLPEAGSLCYSLPSAPAPGPSLLHSAVDLKAVFPVSLLPSSLEAHGKRRLPFWLRPPGVPCTCSAVQRPGEGS